MKTYILQIVHKKFELIDIFKSLATCGLGNWTGLRINHGKVKTASMTANYFCYSQWPSYFTKYFHRILLNYVIDLRKHFYFLILFLILFYSAYLIKFYSFMNAHFLLFNKYFSHYGRRKPTSDRMVYIQTLDKRISINFFHIIY